MRRYPQGGYAVGCLRHIDIGSLLQQEFDNLRMALYAVAIITGVSPMAVLMPHQGCFTLAEFFALTSAPLARAICAASTWPFFAAVNS